MKETMGKRSISDKEIGLIKTMLDRGMKNKDIQFLFNRPERAVNSGRISQIRNGTYGAEVPKATQDNVDEYIRKSKIGRQNAPIDFTSTTDTMHNFSQHTEPLHPDVIAGQFFVDSSGIWRLRSGETDQHECKANFGFKHSGDWIRPIAAFANNRGGYLFFGIDDRSYAVIGLSNDEFIKADPAKFTRIIRSYLDPTPNVRTTIAVIGGKNIGIMHVEQHPARPVIVRTGDGKTLKEGDILFRYSGSCDRIKYSDLRAIIDSREKMARLNILPLVEKLLALGPARALLADLESGVLDDGKRSINIDPSLLDQIKFIREGEFDEKAGAPALKLVGDITANGTKVATRIVRANITDDAALRNFLNNENVAHPLDYLVHSAHSNREWLPIWYYVHHAGVSVDKAIEKLNNEVASQPSNRDGTIARLNSRRSAFKINIGRPKQLLEEFATGQFGEPKDDSEAKKFALAIQGLPDHQIELTTLMKLLLKCYERAETPTASHRNLKSAVFRAACRLDELLWKPKL